MKAIEIKSPGGLDKLVLVDRPEPRDPGPGEIKVRIRAGSLNYHDYVVVSGMTSPADRRIPMSDGAGEVIAVGQGVTEFREGDSVMSLFFPTWLSGPRLGQEFENVPGESTNGCACEFVTTPATWFTRVPRGFSHGEAATLPCAALTAWRALVVNGGLAPGQKVLVMGTGGVSIFALQFAKAMNATVIATSSCEVKLARLQQLGADHVINYRTTESWGREVFNQTGGVDHVVEVGGARTLDQSMAAVRIGGHIALIGLLGGSESTVNTTLMIGKEPRIQGLTVGNRAHQLDMVAGIEAIGLRPVIDRHFPLAALADAFRYQESGRHFGKIVVDI
jgi:NADPH:quinone reductase-like Zn-dependent oxidoreductase